MRLRIVWNCDEVAHGITRKRVLPFTNDQKYDTKQSKSKHIRNTGVLFIVFSSLIFPKGVEIFGGLYYNGILYIIIFTGVRFEKTT